MKKKLFYSFLFSLFTILSFGQNDSSISKKYFNDTLNFISFPNTILYDSIIINEKIKYFEVNTDYRALGLKNLYRSSNIKQLPDSTVLSRTRQGFGTICPPSGCVWYISAETKRGKIINVDDLETLKNFLNSLDNKFNAYLWLTSQDLTDSRFVPYKTIPQLKYKVVEDGFLIILPDLRISDCPVTNADVIYFVGKDGKIVRLKSKIKSKSKVCI